MVSEPQSSRLDIAALVATLDRKIALADAHARHGVTPRERESAALAAREFRVQLVEALAPEGKTS